jgi:hypothetical protein
MGINTISQIGQKVTYFLGLNNPEAYTSHSFRRTGSTLLANEGISLFNLKRFGRWKSDSVAQRYVDTSERSKQEIATMFTCSLLKGDSNKGVETTAHLQKPNRNTNVDITNLPTNGINLNFNTPLNNMRVRKCALCH